MTRLRTRLISQWTRLRVPAIRHPSGARSLVLYGPILNYAFEKVPGNILPTHSQGILLAALSILFTRVLVGILLEYRWYFPADFDESAFLSGRRYTFTGFYPAFFYVHIVSGPVSIVLASFLVLTGGLARFRRWH
ncbi:MAG: hypothetical protein KDA72_18485 [Planctomycetales bacterium]|nr:hypothetical protein [Planctomycetales bacterium]